MAVLTLGSSYNDRVDSSSTVLLGTTPVLPGSAALSSTPLVVSTSSIDTTGTPSKHELTLWHDSDTLAAAEGYIRYVSRSTFSVLVSAANTSGDRTTIVINEDVSVDSDTTINSNITLKFVGGKKITVATGKVLTLNGTIEADRHDQIFSVSEEGAVAGSPTNEVYYPEWFGATRDGVTNDLDEIRYTASLVHSRSGGTLHFSAGKYQCWGYISIYDDTTVEGEGMAATELEAATSYGDQDYIYYTASGSVWYRRTGFFAIGSKSGSGTYSTTHVCESVSNVTIRDMKFIQHDDEIGYPLYGSYKTTTVSILAERRAYDSVVAYNDIFIENIDCENPMVLASLGGTNLGEGDPWGAGPALPQYRYTIRNCHVTEASNKVVEVSNVKHCNFHNNYINGGDGFQAIGYSSDINVTDNTILHEGIGISLTNGIDGAVISGNHVEKLTADAGSNISSHRPNFLFGYQVSSSYGSTWTDFIQKEIIVDNNIFVNEHGTTSSVLFGTSQSITSAAQYYLNNTIVSNNVMKGDIILPGYQMTSGYAHFEDIEFIGNRVKGNVISSYGKECTNFTIEGGSIESAPNITTASSGGYNFRNVFFESGITINATPANCSVVGCTVKTGSTISVNTSGTNTAANNTTIN